MTKLEAYRFLSNQHRGISFVANVLLTRGGPNSAKRLKALARLVSAGAEVTSAPFSTDHLCINGCILPFGELDNIAKPIEH